MLTPKFRLLWPRLFTPEVNKLSGKLEYSCVAVFPASTNKKELEAAIIEAGTKKWGADKKKWPKNLKSPIRANEEREKDGKLPDGYEEGGFFITLKSPVQTTDRYQPPKIYDKNKKPMEDQTNLYGGAWCVALINPYAYQHASGNAGVSFYLEAVLKVGDADPIAGNRVSPEAAFQGVEIDDKDMGEADASSLFS